MPRRLRCGSLSLLVLLTGCYDGYDPLDPDLLAQIARSRGDAEGFERSGYYSGTYETIECGCEEYTSARALSLCFQVEQADQFGLQSAFPIQIVQADGTVRLLPAVEGDGFSNGPLLPTFYGPLSADGTLQAAGILEADELVFVGRVLARIDGTFEGSGTEGTLRGEYQQRYILDFIGLDVDLIDVGQPATPDSVDCREVIEFDLSFAAVLPPVEDPFEE